MRKTLISTLALAMVFAGAVAGAQDRSAGVTTLWDGLANGADAVALTDAGWGSGVTWTETATGYDCLQPAGWAGSFLTADDGIPPSDYRVTLSIDHTDLVTEYAGAAVGFWLWGPAGPAGTSVGLGYAYDPGCACYYFEIEVGGVTTYGGPAVPGSQTTIRIERVGDIVTWSFMEAGDASFTELQTSDLAALGFETDDGDAGLYFWAPAGATTRINYVEWSNPPAAAATATITQSASTPDPFVDGTASWDVNFSEDVTGVTAGAFLPSLSGTAGSDATATLDSGSGAGPYVVTVANVTIGVDNIGSIGLNFDGTGVTDVAGSGIDVAGSANAAQYLIGAAAAPTANNWVLVFMGIVLALAATAVIRKRALEQ